MKPESGPWCFGDLLLRPMRETDIETIRKWRNRDDIRCWFRTSTRISKTQQQAWFEGYRHRDNDVVWLLEDASRPGKAVGQAAIYAIDHVKRRAEVGRFIAAPQERGKGYMVAACNALVFYGFMELHLDLITLEVLHGNFRARHIYELCGFRETGRQDGLIVMTLIRKEWFANSAEGALCVGQMSESTQND